MLQILDLGLWEGISYGLVKALYGTVMRAYEFLLSIVDGQEPLNFASFASDLYVIAGLFMLFRAIIAMVQMIINPDQITDKNAGTGKLITRIVVVIVLLLAFQPNGLLLGETGLLGRIENAILADDGLIHNINKVTINVDSDVAYANEENSSPNVETNSLSKYLVEDVYAEKNSDGSETCWFYKPSSTTGQKRDTAYVISGIYKVKFAQSKLDSGYKKVDRKDNAELYYKFVTEPDVFVDSNGKSINQKYKSGSSLFQQWYLFSEPKKVSNCNNWYLKSVSGRTGLKLFHEDGRLNDTSLAASYRGYNDLESLAKAIKIDVQNIDSDDKVVGETDGIAGSEIENNHAVSYDQRAKDFGLALISCFEECNNPDSEAKKDCETAKEKQFDATGSKTIIDLMKKEDLTLSFLIAIVAGLAVLIYLIILAVDVIVRGFKLAFLELLAPIPIISYVDPKDKVFNQWIKMYIATYVDIFIKLLALCLVEVFIAELIGTPFFEGSVFRKFLTIVAILVFAKLVPTMISKIFGLDSLGGSFKDIAGMAKKGAGFATGAALTGAVGFATGQGLGRLSGLAKGAIIGGASGAKGNVFGGAQKIGKSNYLDNYGKSKGMSWLDRKIASISGTLGLPDPYERAQEEKASYDNYVSKASKANDEALSTIRKLIGNGQATGKFSDLEEAWAQARVINAGGHIDRYERQANNTYKDTKTGNIIDMNTYNNLSDSEKYLDNEVVEHVKGAEKAAIKQFNAAVESGNYATVGLNASKDAGDIEKHKAFIKSANVAAVQAGYSEHNSDNKTDAETKSAILGTEMDIHEVAHKFKQSK